MNCKNWRFHKTSRLKTTSSQSPKNWFVEWSHHRATCLCVLPSQFRTHHCALIAKLIASHQIECLRSCVRAKEHVIFCTCAGCRVQSTARKDVKVKAGESACNNGDAEKENKICKCSNLLGWKYRYGIFCTGKNYRSRCSAFHLIPHLRVVISLSVWVNVRWKVQNKIN